MKACAWSIVSRAEESIRRFEVSESATALSERRAQQRDQSAHDP